ncbi:class A beta-lactamase [Arboricoccus pini]|nr:class A beta-lactamase [Arboricoccus pini]
MSIFLSRRAMIAGLSIASGAIIVGPAWAQSDPAIAAIEQRHGGRLGVFAVDTGSNRALAHRSDERFLMCSTFKGLLGALILARVDQGKESLQRRVTYSEQDLIFTSPITKTNVAKGQMSVEDLLEAMLVYSDNTAAILLMRSAGGPAALTQFLRGIGDTVTRSDRYEPKSNQYDGALDTTSPRAIIGSAYQILIGNVLTPASRARLESGMIACKPGVRRIRASLPASWSIGDRPGENVTEESNDYAIVRPPGRAPLLIATYYDDPHRSTADREAVIRDVGSAFVAWANG